MTLNQYKWLVLNPQYESQIQKFIGNDYSATIHGRQNQFFLHAEIEAIRKCPDIDTLIIIRKSKDGNFANATPCPICKLAISHYGISNVYHT